jgi:DNA-binding MarR family transcriptional regulator
MDDVPDQPAGPPLPAVSDRLGYLLKHAQIHFNELIATALAPLGITGRQSAVLMAIDGLEPLSQQEIAARLGVDRTSMVALIDELVDKRLVSRRQQPADRRKNVVELTERGRSVLRRARAKTAEVERAFLAPLSTADAQHFRHLLRSLLRLVG